jgi:multidrug efflux pump subunit AcrA (membrane-fusion protein)
VTFYKVEKRPIAKILKVPGYFELEPKSKQRYILPISGRIDLKVKALAKVKRGDVLMSLDSPQWRDLQMKLLGAKESIRDAELEYIEASSANLALGAFGADADGHSLSAAKLKLAQAAVQNQKSKFQQWLIQASLLSSYSVEELLEDKGRRPLWHRLQRITFRAVQDGVVDRLHFSSGSWGEAGQMVLSTVAPSKLRFKAKVLQADALDQSLEGLSVRIMPPKGRGRDESHEPIMGKVKLGVTGDSVTRTTDIFIDLQNQKVAKWMRPQLSALAEIVLEGGLEKSVLSIPKRALIQDGLDTVFFRRRKGRPDEVYRTIADLGVRGLAEVEVKQGLELGDEVVMDGLYQLKLSTTGQKVEAGHFHADGTWHDGDH